VGFSSLLSEFIPKEFSKTDYANIALFLSLIVEGYPGLISMFTEQLLTEHAPWAACLIFSSMSFLVSVFVYLKVPPIVTLSGITLKADPPSIFVNESTD